MLVFSDFRINSSPGRIFFVVPFLVFAILHAHAQTSTIHGRVIDYHKNPIPGATVIINRLADSTRIAGTVTDPEGIFTFNKMPLRDTLFMEVTFIGFSPFHTKLYLTGSSVSMDSLLLEEGITELSEIQVTGQRPAVVYKGDTIEYNAGSYQTRPYAEVNELISQLPGLGQDDEGNLTFNGRKVAKILVDGREYFGTNGRIALNTLPVDIVRKIQVMSVTQDDILRGRNPEDKILNIQLKEDVRTFGNVIAGGGHPQRYEAMGMLSHMNDNTRISVMAFANNVNIATYGSQSNAVSMISSGNGITKTLGSAINYSQQLSKKTEVSAVLDYNHPETTKESVKSRTQFLIPDSSFYTKSNSSAVNKSHNVYAYSALKFSNSPREKIEFVVDGFTLSDMNSVTTNSSITTDESGKNVNGMETVYRGNTTNFSLPLSAGWYKRFSNKSQLDLRGLARWTNESANDFNTGTTIYHIGDQDSVSQLNQEIIKKNVSEMYGIQAGYTFNFSPKGSVSLTEALQIRQADNETNTYTINDDEERTGLDSTFSNSFRSFAASNNLQCQVTYQLADFAMTVGALMSYNLLDQDNETIGSRVRQETLNWSPQVRLAYKMKDNRQIGLSYRASTTPPSVTQLQPVTNNTNPLFIQQGNPNLRPVFYQDYDLSFSALSEEGRSVNAGLSFRPVNDMIISTISIDENGRQVSSYVNVDGIMTVSTSLAYGQRKTTEKATLQFNVSANISYAQDKNFINERLAVSHRLNASPRLRVSYGIQELFDASVTYMPSLTSVTYQYANNRDQQFAIQNVNATVDVFPFRNFYWRNGIGYVYNGSLPEGFTKATALWNMELSYQVLKSKRGEIKLMVYDVLRQNRNISRTASENYVESTQSNNLQQYLMLSFKYHIR